MTSSSERPKKRGLLRNFICADLYLKALREVRSHALLIGKVAFYWNAVHAVLQTIFIEMAGERDEKGRIDPAGPARIWHDQASDSGQRALLLAFGELRLTRDPEVLGRLKWAIEQLNALATYRNDAIHVPFTGSDFTPHPLAAQLNRLNRLNSVGHRKLFRALIHDLNYLGDFLWRLKGHLERPNRPDTQLLPERPTLRARLLVEKSPPMSNGRPECPEWH
jgi:hypothetical protein